MTSTAIRPAVLSDAAAIAGIQVRGWRAAYRGLMPDAILDGLSVDERTDRWARLIGTPASPEERFWLITTDGVAAGFASTGRSRDPGAATDTFELYALYLEPDCIGRGFGARLFRHAIDDLRARGARAVTLWVLEGNERAANFYERMGMVSDGTKIESVRGASLPHRLYRMSM